MDEMTLLKALGRDLEAQPPATLADQRNRLMEAARPSARAPRRKFLSLGVLTAATSISIAAGTVMATHPAWLPGHGDPAKRPGPGGTMVNASSVLSLAADTVEARPAVHPRPKQWAYTKQVQTPDRGMDPLASSPSPGRTEITERWMRFDGTKSAGLDGEHPGRLQIFDEDPDPDETSPIQDYTYLASLPTDPDALVKRMCPGKPQIKTECVFGMAEKYLKNVAIPPRLQGALYRALARLPYLVVRTDAIDLAGRHDLAISEAYPGDFQSETILLDPRTYEYRGEELSWTQGGPLVSPNGTIAPHDTSASARLAAGVVDRPGNRP